MRYKGRTIEKPQPRVIPIIREPSVQIVDGKEKTVDNNIYFVADVVTDYSDFEKLCPDPKIPFMTRPGVGSVENVEDPAYKLALMAHQSKRTDWLVLRSLKATEGLEWETVDLSKADTWAFYKQELRDAGFNPVEIQNLINEVLLHNAIDSDKMDEARKSFLAGQAPDGK